MERIITLNVCIGPLCNHKIMGCSIDGVKSYCWRCRTKSTCDIPRYTTKYHYDFCSKCILAEREEKNEQEKKV